MFEFSEDEVDELWGSVDLNGDGLITRPKAALLLKRAVVLQHDKMEAMVTEKLEKEEDIEAGLIRGIPRWMQWCAARGVGRPFTSECQANWTKTRASSFSRTSY